MTSTENAETWQARRWRTFGDRITRTSPNGDFGGADDDFQCSTPEALIASIHADYDQYERAARAKAAALDADDSYKFGNYRAENNALTASLKAAQERAEKAEAALDAALADAERLAKALMENFPLCVVCGGPASYFKHNDNFCVEHKAGQRFVYDDDSAIIALALHAAQTETARNG